MFSSVSSSYKQNAKHLRNIATPAVACAPTSPAAPQFPIYYMPFYAGYAI